MLPSEREFQLGKFNHTDLFGERKGLVHSPHLRAQMDMDTNLVLLLFGLSFLHLVWENKRSYKLSTLRDNLENVDMGFFPSEEDFN